MELMVVVIIVALLATLAIPSMSRARLDRHVYDDAGYIAQLFRTARSRAIGRGSATMVQITTNGATDRGTLQMYEAVTQNVDPTTGAATVTTDVSNRTPFGSCTTPGLWNTTAINAPTGKALYIDGVFLNSNIETLADIQTTVSILTASGTTTPAVAFICFSPLGRTYVDTTSASNPVFGGKSSLISLQMKVRRNTGSGQGMARTVVVPPSGMARIITSPN